MLNEMNFDFSVPNFLDMEDPQFLEKFDEETPELHWWFFLDDDINPIKKENTTKYGKLISK